MTYIENIYICLVAPLLVAMFCSRERRFLALVFIASGMTACLLSSYISSYFAAVYETDQLVATLEIAPVVEETMKMLPVLFYLLVFQPKMSISAGETIMVAVGFATLENACYLLTNGASRFTHLLIRGFSTGAMHIICATLTGLGLQELWDRIALRMVGTVSMLSAAIVFHGVFNILVSQTGAAAIIGYAMPLLAGGMMAWVRNYRRKIKRMRGGNMNPGPLL